MALFYDTNILLLLARDTDTPNRARRLVNPRLQPEFTSIVCLAELRAIVTQNKWGGPKLRNLNDQVDSINVLNVNDELVSRYVDIDTFSIYNVKEHAPSDKKNGSRTMGKNDLWVAASASVLNMTLLTTDKDYNHLQGIFLDVKVFHPMLFKA